MALVREFFSLFARLKIGKELLGEPPVCPNHTRCSSAEDVASARAAHRQNGEGENTLAYSSALEKIGRRNKRPFT